MPIKRAAAALAAVVAAALLPGCFASDEDVFAIRFVNDTPRAVTIGACKSSSCRSGERHFTATIPPGGTMGQNVVSDRGFVSAFLVTGPGGRRVGCFFLEFGGERRPGTVERISRARPCPGRRQ
jgi:hypothetical protein